MSPPLHQRLLNEATQHGTDEVLRLMPADKNPEMVQAIRQGVRQAVLYYAFGVDSLDKRLNPVERGKVRA